MLLIAGLLWNPADVVAAESVAGHGIVAEAGGDADQPPRDAVLASTGVPTRPGRVAEGQYRRGLIGMPPPGPVFPPPERPPRA